MNSTYIIKIQNDIQKFQSLDMNDEDFFTTIMSKCKNLNEIKTIKCHYQKMK